MSPYNLHKKIIAVIVLFSPSLMSCLNPYDLQTVAQETSSLVERDGPGIAILPIENKLKTTILIKDASENGLLGKRFTLKKGQEIQFYAEAGLLKARIEESAGFLSRSFVLPVYFAGGSFGKSFEPSQVHILSASSCMDQSYVYIGKLGLAGGMKEGKKEVVTKDKEEREEEEVKERYDNLSEIPGLGYFAILPADILGEILSYVGDQERGYMREANRSFYQQLTGYSKPGMVGVAYKPVSSLHKASWVLKRTIDFRSGTVTLTPPDHSKFSFLSAHGYNNAFTNLLLSSPERN